MSDVNRHSEGGSERRLVFGQHRFEMQAPRLLSAKRRADNARCVANNERHLFRRAMRGRDKQVAFILPVVVVGHDHNLALSASLDRGFDALMTVAHGSTSKAASRARLERPCRSLPE